jgi:hypothetical protein
MKTAVEWLVDQMRQRKEQGLTLSFYDLEMFAEKAKEMEEDGKHESYLYGQKVGYTKANELWETSKKVAENQPRLKNEEQ